MIGVKHLPRTLLVVALLHGAMAVQATQMVPLSIAELSARAQAIVRGTVVSKRVIKRDAGGLLTKVGLRVAETIKGGKAFDDLEIVQSGGVLGERRTTVVGAAHFSIGEEVVAFLVFNQRGEAVVLALAQGKFKVFRDAAGVKHVRNPFHGGGEPDGGSRRALLNKLGNRRLPLDELRRRVKAAVK